MTVIELSDEQAAALKAKAAEQGLTLEAWLQKLAAVDPPVLSRKNRYSLSELMAQCDLAVPLSAEDSAWLNAPAVGREA
jgi:antitoxin component of MazEF toxin-antitoxin module